MQPYVIRQGDYLAKLAHRHGFDATSVWAAPANAKLRDARPNPNVLSPGDVLWIPPPPSSAPPPVLDNAGLADEGTLDSSTAQALVQAHGS